MGKKELFQHPIMRKGHVHKTHDSRALKRAKLSKDMDECDERYIEEELEEFEKNRGDKEI